MLLYVGAAALLIPSCHAGRIRKSKEPAVLAEAKEALISGHNLLNTDGHEMPSECGETYEYASKYYATTMYGHASTISEIQCPKCPL